MNPHKKNQMSVVEAIKSFKRNQWLIVSLVKREIVGRYRGSTLGLLWSLFNPLVMLAVYTFVFGVVYQARWHGSESSKPEFSLTLFAGLMIFNFFSECLSRAPWLIVGNVNYVKKVVFPLETLSVVSVMSALFHFVVSFFVWLFFHLVIIGIPKVTVLYLPLVMLPLILVALGVSWIVSAVATYLRDVGQVVTVFTTILMFISPVFYSISALPEKYQRIIYLNPLVYFVEQGRAVMILGGSLDWYRWCLAMLGACLILWIGFAVFQRARRGFSDVV